MPEQSRIALCWPTPLLRAFAMLARVVEPGLNLRCGSVGLRILTGLI